MVVWYEGIYFSYKRIIISNLLNFSLAIIWYIAAIWREVHLSNLSLWHKGGILTMEKKLLLKNTYYRNRCLNVFPSLCDFVAKNYLHHLRKLLNVHLYCKQSPQLRVSIGFVLFDKNIKTVIILKRVKHFCRVNKIILKIFSSALF